MVFSFPKITKTPTSHNVTFTTLTTEVKVMPEGALYWYGNGNADVTVNSVNGIAIAKSTNSISINQTSRGWTGHNGIQFNGTYDTSKYSVVHIGLKTKLSRWNQSGMGSYPDDWLHINDEYILRIESTQATQDSNYKTRDFQTSIQHYDSPVNVSLTIGASETQGYPYTSELVYVYFE